MKDNSWITRQVEGGGAGFDAQWSAGFVEAVRAALIPADDAARSMRALASMIAQSYNDNAFARVIFTESHDADSNGAQRMPEMIWPGNPSSWASIKRSTLGAALVLTAPGIPLLFMGQEFLAAGWFNDDKQLDWSRAAQFQGIHTLCRDLIHLRRNWFDHTRGLGGQGTRMFHVNDADKVIAYHRWDRGGPRDDVIVLLNFANRGYASYTIGLPRAGGWRLRFNSDWVGYHPSLGNWPSFDMQADQAGRDGMPSSGSVALGPYSALILSQD
jgi:1,4-alpha-glucan branching enzyme